MTPRKPRTLLQAAILAAIQDGMRDPRQIAARAGCREYTVYRTAQEFGLEVRRHRHHRTAHSGMLSVRNIKCKYKGFATYAFIPVPALRAAGLQQETTLAFTVEGGRITIGKPATITKHEETKPTKTHEAAAFGVHASACPEAER